MDATMIWPKVKDLAVAKAEGGVGYTKTKTTELLTATTLEFAMVEEIGAPAALIASFGLADGAKVRVVWDGIPYEGVVHDTDGTVYFGNGSFIGVGDDTSEPFVYVDSNDVGIWITDGESSHTVSVFRHMSVAVPIQHRFFPHIELITKMPSVGVSTPLSAQESKELEKAFQSGTPVFIRAEILASSVDIAVGACFDLVDNSYQWSYVSDPIQSGDSYSITFVRVLYTRSTDNGTWYGRVTQTDFAAELAFT